MKRVLQGQGQVRVLIMSLVAISFVLISMHLTSPSTYAASTTGTTARFWLQTIDSCRQAIPGARFELTGPNVTREAGPAPGTRPRTVPSRGANCPIQRGNCVAVATGCLSFILPVPRSGTLTYKITDLTSRAHYVICLGGSTCPGGPTTVNLTINASGRISARVVNIYPNRQTITFPTTGVYAGTQADPAVVHNSRLGNLSCDGDGDADDHTSGSEGHHRQCDSDADR